MRTSKGSRVAGQIWLLGVVIAAAANGQRFPPPGSTPDPDGRRGAVVIGRVVDPAGDAVAGAEVEGYLRSAVRAVYAVTDLDGMYRLDLPQRSEFWELRVRAEGFHPVSVNIGIWRDRERQDFELLALPPGVTQEAESRARRRARTLMREGLAAAEKGDRKRAISKLEKAVATDPSYGAALNNLGVQQRLSGRLTDAEAQFRAALAADAGDPIAGFNLGALLYDTGRYAAAIPVLEAASRLDPGAQPLALQLARAYLAGADRRALDAFRQVLLLAAESATADAEPLDLALEISDALVLDGQLLAALDAKRTWLASHINDPRADQVRATVAKLNERVAAVPWTP